mmetsp:Transcript_38749/g.115225  ORF Transcript_38749/g.115225 Transcript_38749/m.115225 type:complete len:317 (-) Transcript_38749:1012-1962(-)
MRAARWRPGSRPTAAACAAPTPVLTARHCRWLSATSGVRRRCKSTAPSDSALSLARPSGTSCASSLLTNARASRDSLSSMRLSSPSRALAAASMAAAPARTLTAAAKVMIMRMGALTRTAAARASGRCLMRMTQRTMTRRCWLSANGRVARARWRRTATSLTACNSCRRGRPTRSLDQLGRSNRLAWCHSVLRRTTETRPSQLAALRPRWARPPPLVRQTQWAAAPARRAMRRGPPVWRPAMIPAAARQNRQRAATLTARTMVPTLDRTRRKSTALMAQAPATTMLLVPAAAVDEPCGGECCLQPGPGTHVAVHEL